MNNNIDVYHFDMKKAHEISGGLLFIRPKVEDIQKFLNDGMYQKVVNVKTDDLEEAFKLTNHIDNSWLENTNVETIVNKARSTSVGDLFVKNNEVFLVSSMGFEKMPTDFKNILEDNKKQDKKLKLK